MGRPSCGSRGCVRQVLVSVGVLHLGGVLGVFVLGVGLVGRLGGGDEDALGGDRGERLAVVVEAQALRASRTPVTRAVASSSGTRMRLPARFVTMAWATRMRTSRSTDSPFWKLVSLSSIAPVSLRESSPVKACKRLTAVGLWGVLRTARALCGASAVCAVRLPAVAVAVESAPEVIAKPAPASVMPLMMPIRNFMMLPFLGDSVLTEPP